MKQTCEYCGKPNIDGRHRNLCSKNPKNMPEVIAEPEVATPFLEPTRWTLEIPISETAPGGDEIRTLKCPTCGEKSIWLNALDYRCPNCGDREMRRPLPAGVK